MSVKIDGASFRAGLHELEGRLYRAAADAITDAVDAAAKDAFSTNEFRNHSWKLRLGTKATVDKFAFSGRLSNRVKYASYIEKGTRAHVIEARRKPMLRFYWTSQGAWFSGKRVNHPGTEPRPFFQHAGQVGESHLQRSLTHLVEQSVTRFNRAA